MIKDIFRTKGMKELDKTIMSLRKLADKKGFIKEEIYLINAPVDTKYYEQVRFYRPWIGSFEVDKLVVKFLRYSVHPLTSRLKTFESTTSNFQILYDFQIVMGIGEVKMGSTIRFAEHEIKQLEFRKL